MSIDNTNSIHDCCGGDNPKPAKPGTGPEPSPANPAKPVGGTWPVVGAVVSAIAASACCWLPLLLLAVGASVAGVGSLFQTVRPYLLMVSALFLAGAFYLAYLRKPQCAPDGSCSPGEASSRRRTRVLFWVALALTGTFALFPYYGAALIRAASGTAGQSALRSTAAPKSGTPVLASTYLYHIGGMDCPVCAPEIQLKLAKLPGVALAKVSYTSKTARILTGTGHFDNQQVIRLVHNMGYHAVLIRKAVRPAAPPAADKPSPQPAKQFAPTSRVPNIATKGQFSALPASITGLPPLPASRCCR